MVNLLALLCLLVSGYLLQSLVFVACEECTPDTVNTNDRCSTPFDRFEWNLRNKSICSNGYNETGQKQIDTLFRAFSMSSVVDLVIIIDRSTSIRCEQFQCAKDLLIRMVSHLVRGGHMAIGPEHTRVAVVSFGIYVTSEYDGISDKQQAEKLNSCNFGSKVPDSAYPTNGSNLAAALKKAESILRAGQLNRKSKQILIIAGDGETTDDADKGYNIVRESIDNLKRLGVERFAIGQDGGWFDTKEREESVMKIATDLDHYACRYVWSLGLRKQGLPMVPTVQEGIYYIKMCIKIL